MTSLTHQLGRWAWGRGDQARSLTAVLPVMAMVIMACLLVVLGLLMAKATRESAQNEQGNVLAAEAKTFAGLLDQSIARELADLESRAATLAALDLHREPRMLRAWINAIGQKLPEYTWIGFADPQGVVKASSADMLAGQSVAEREWFSKGLASPVTVDLHEAKLLEPLLPQRSDGPWRFIDLAVPLLDLQGNSHGVVGAHLSWDWLMGLQRKFAEMLPLPRHAEVFVVGSDGKVRLAGMSVDHWMLGELESFQRAAAGASGWVRETWPDGNQYLVGFSNTPNAHQNHSLQWMTLIRVPSQNFDTAADYAIAGIWALVGATVLLFYVGTRMVLRVALSPVRSLVAQISEVAQHGGRVDLSVASPREFRALGEATNQMIRSLEASQSADLAKSKFLADMSHELRTLLHGMLSHLELVRVGSDPVQREKDFKAGIEYGNELLSLLNNMLDLSTIEEGKLRINRSMQLIAELVRTNTRLYETLALAKGIELTLEISVPEALTVSTDPVRLGQILRNLVANAVKFTAKGGVTVRLETEEVYSPDGVRNTLHLRVQDTGIGLTQAQQEIIFGRFEQADPSVHVRFGGSGLGLSLARALTEALGGKMTLRSEINKGSEFAVVLPLNASESLPVATTVDYIPTPAQKLRVLCVDDLEENRTVLCRWLALHGHESHTAETGHEAINKAALQPFDVILMDIDLPDMQGTDVIRAIRSSGSKSATATIYTVSGHAFDSDIERSIASGSNGHIPKPIDYKLLLAKLSEQTRPN